MRLGWYFIIQYPKCAGVLLILLVQPIKNGVSILSESIFFVLSNVHMARGRQSLLLWFWYINYTFLWSIVTHQLRMSWFKEKTDIFMILKNPQRLFKTKMIEYLHSAHWFLVIFCNNFKRKEDSILVLNIELFFLFFTSRVHFEIRSKTFIAGYNCA